MHHLRLPRRQQYRGVLSFVELPNGSVWAGSSGVARIDPHDWSIQGTAVPALAEKPILAMARAGNNVLLGTYEGLFQFDVATRRTKQYKHDPATPTSLVNNTVRSINRIDESWWIGTARGISIADRLDLSNGFRNLQHQDQAMAGSSSDFIGSIVQGPRDNVWIATFGGLAQAGPGGLDGPKPRLAIWTGDNGLSSDKVNAALVDNAGVVWASVSNGINRIDQATGTVRALGRRDGVYVDSYVNTAAARGPQGRLLFGGLGGLVVVNPDFVAPTPGPAPLLVTGMRIGVRQLPYAALPREGDPVHLDAHTRSLQLDFALLDFRSPSRTRYSYRLQGLDKGWVEVAPGNVPRAHYANLPHGEYTLELRAMTGGLHPREVLTRLRVTVAPAWYQTVAAKIAGALLLLALIALLVYLRTLMLQRRAQHLQRQIALRTHELQEANARLDHLAGTDSLTGACTRRRFLELVHQRMRKAPDEVACLAVLDVDHFKRVNDTYGHLAGDEALRHVGRIIRRHCRDGDLVGRLGGAEFMIHLPGTSIDAAHVVAERIRITLATSRTRHEDQEIRISASIGVAQRLPAEPLRGWLIRADAELYRAKHAGRNCTRTDTHAPD